jgi:hypothetical protein
VEQQASAGIPVRVSTPRGQCRFRQAEVDELARAASLCQPAPARCGEGPLRCFVAVRPQPIERLLAAAFWKLVPETAGTHSAEIQWTALPALGDELLDFIDAFVAHVSDETEGGTAIAHADWLIVGHPAAAVLQAAGFAVVGTRTVFQADAAVFREALAETPPLESNAGVVPPRGDHFDALRALLCGAWLRPSELAHGLHTAWSESPCLFDPRCSGVVVDGDQIVAACLANVSHGHLTLAALAGPPNACARLLSHCLQGRDGPAESATLSFLLDDRDPPGALAGLVERLPHQAVGQLRRYARTAAEAMADSKGAQA